MARMLKTALSIMVLVGFILIDGLNYLPTEKYTMHNNQEDEKKQQISEEISQQSTPFSFSVSSTSLWREKRNTTREELSRAVAKDEGTLLKALEDEDNAIRFTAVEALGQLSKVSPLVVQKLLNLLEHKEFDVRSSAATAFKHLKSVSSEVEKQILNLLKHKEADIRYSAVMALGHLVNPSPAVETALAKAVNDPYPSVSCIALDQLSRLPNATPLVESVLISQAVNLDQQTSIRAAAIDSLAQLNKPTAAVEATLVVLLKDKDGWIRSAAVAALGKFSNLAPGTLSTLLTMVKDSDQRVLIGLVNILLKLQPSLPVEKALLILLDHKDEDHHVRYETLSRLRNHLNSVTPAIETRLVELAKEESEAVFLLFELQRASREKPLLNLLNRREKGYYDTHLYVVKYLKDSPELLTPSLKQALVQLAERNKGNLLGSNARSLLKTSIKEDESAEEQKTTRRP